MANVTVVWNNKAISEIKKDINNKLTIVGEFLKSEAKTNCPVKTGQLRDSITSEVGEDSVIVGTNVEYAPFIEQGTQNIQPYFFLTRALLENINRIKAFFKK